MVKKNPVSVIIGGRMVAAFLSFLVKPVKAVFAL